MKRLILALLCSALPAAAQDASTAAAPETRNKYAPEIREAMRSLSILLERGAEVKPAKLDALSAELKKFDNKVKDALGREILEQAAAKEKEIEDRARAAAAKKTLQDLRLKLQADYAEKGGVYPADLSALAGGIPALLLPGHGQAAGVRVIDSKKYDWDLGKAVDDTGGWLYFSAAGSASYGMLLLDCGHKDADGTEFYKY